MAVDVVVEGIRDIPESTYRADIENRLKSAGITLLPLTDNKDSYPPLELDVTAGFVDDQRGNLLGSFVINQLRLQQLFTRNGDRGPEYYAGYTWDRGGYAVDSGIRIAGALREGYTAEIDEFVADYKKANGLR